MSGSGRTGGGTPVAGPPTWDSRLLRRLRSGDETALGEVYDELAPYVYGLARRVTAQATLAEEITQEVFVHIWQHADRIDDERGTVRSYLGMLTHRRAVDLVRREHARRARERRVVDRAPLAEADVHETVVAIMEAEGLRRSLDDLPAEQRSVVVAVYLEGATYREIAVALGVPEGTAKSRGRLGLAKLAAALAALGGARGSSVVPGASSGPGEAVRLGS